MRNELICKQCKHKMSQVRDTEINCPKCNHKGEQDRVFTSQYICNNSSCSVLEFIDDCLELNITLDEKVWNDEP